MFDDVRVLDRLVTSAWGDSDASGRRSAVAIVLYAVAALGGAALALSGDGGGARVGWGISAIVFGFLAVTLAARRSQGRRSEAPDPFGGRPR